MDVKDLIERVHGVLSIPALDDGESQTFGRAELQLRLRAEALARVNDWGQPLGQGSGR